MPNEIILFGGSRNNRRWSAFSNFYYSPFTWRGHLWPHAEGAFQWAKDVDNPKHLGACMSSRPSTAKRAGRLVTLPPDWSDIRYGVMVDVLEAKFVQSLPLRELLRSTGHAAIHEDRPDPVWGGGPSYPTGQDLLGKALMEVRERLRETQ